ncbi:hypothetical protein GCM10010495_09530 [Kitasatospora herbaricolor]|nr:hypothetical protein GCM10010495_09530 [Kitasatospora herbaricolor]
MAVESAAAWLPKVPAWAFEWTALSAGLVTVGKFTDLAADSSAPTARWAPAAAAGEPAAGDEPAAKAALGIRATPAANTAAAATRRG